MAALRAQITQERQRISDASDGVADELATYQRLVLEREFAKQALAAAVNSLETARQEARRQQLCLERVVEPAAADSPMAPERLRTIATAIGLNMLGLLVGWLILSGLREHGSRAS
jgi:capsular polysaccharide transport system permease protein